ncbi:YhgE/Pip family protein [Marisediminicola senii]|uniref:YhgE/Pip family protein n=1 Tax=Marisediminicola senii TaxID=2711233 RepID=UPI0013E9B6C8|nr:YhgE/Pip family protein [Marisediminicola senii]
MSLTPVTPAKRRRRRTAALAIVTVVPLAVAGFFIGALSQADDRFDTIPAAIVNSDELVYQTAADGSETPVFAGRQLVTELTSEDNDAFDWQITNAEDAEEALAAGEVYAVLTVPQDFSESILSLQSDDPRQAQLSISTDDAHSYLASIAAETVGTGLASTFGREITAQYLTGIYSSIGSVGESFGTAADGADGIATGATDLGNGLGELATGAESAQTGATSLASGVRTYTSGVSSLSSGLAQLDTGASGLSGISTGVTDYTSGVSALAGPIADATALLTDDNLANDPIAVATLSALSGNLTGLAANGPTLASQTASGITGIQGGISQSATGASRLAAGSSGLTTGADSLAGGLGDLTTGAQSAASGATALATGAGELAAGLRTGADSVPAMDGDAAAATVDVVTEPVAVDVQRENEVSSIGRIIATFLVPIGLWIGALAIVMVARRATRNAMASTGSTRRLVLSTLAKAAGIAAIQAVILVAMLHVALGVDWALLPLTLGFSLLTSIAFTAFHQLLVAWFGRAGLVVSVVLLALQVTATGGLYPVELLAGPFEVLSPLLPLTYAVSGMQAIIAGSGASVLLTSTVVLLGFGVVSAMLTLSAARRARRTSNAAILAVPVTASREGSTTAGRVRPVTAG